MATVTESVEVEVPVRTAYDQWTQFESFPEFMGGVESVEQVDDRHTHWVTKVRGVRREFDAEIVDQRPNERIAWRSVGGDTRHTGVVTFESVNPTTTRVTVQVGWEPEGVVEQVGRAIGADDMQVRADTRRFKRFIEERGTPAEGWRGTVY